MSLEQALQDNTAALRDLHALLSRTQGIAANDTPAPGKVTTNPPKLVVKPASAATTALTYDDIRRPFTALVAAKGVPAGMAILAQFKVPTGHKLSAIAEGDWPAVIEAINKAAAA